MAVNVTYDGALLTTVADGNTLTITCAGRKMDGDIVMTVPTAPSGELVKGTITLTTNSSSFPLGFIVGMDWDLFLQTVGSAVGAFGEDANGHITFAGDIVYYDGYPVSKQDEVIDGATYTT